MKKLVSITCAFLILNVASVRAQPVTADVLELIELQRQQIRDYEELVQKQNQRLQILEDALNTCQNNYEAKIKSCADEVADSEATASWGYILTAVSILANVGLGAAVAVLWRR